MKNSRVWMIALGVSALACSAAREPPLNRAADETEVAEAKDLSHAVAEMDAAIAGTQPHKYVSAGTRRPREYVDARWYFTSDDDINAWYALSHELEDEFDDICGDTFCEGDYGNYQSLGIRCSVEQRTGTVGACVWTFAASMDEIVATTGAVKIETQTWRCKLPVVRDTPVAEFVRALNTSSEGPLRAKLPRTEASLYDGLVSCL